MLPQTVEIEEDFGELEVAEYLVFSLALDTYMRYLEEHHGKGAEDDLVRRGLQLVRMADRQHMDVVRAFLDGQLPSVSHKRMLGRAFSYLPTQRGMGMRTLQLRTLLSRGGAATMRAVFKTNKALKEIRDAMAAAAVDDADKALDLFDAIPLHNPRLRKWIDQAAASAGAGSFQNPVTTVTAEVSDEIPGLYAATANENAANPSSEASKDAGDARKEILTSVEAKATRTAEKAMQVSSQPDLPPKRSEVVGIAAAAVAAALSDPEIPQNVPAPLKSLDPEQTAAALTDGKVLVAAGAGAGKSTTLVSRIDYLVKERHVNPSRILACSFNKKAADELDGKIARKLGTTAGTANGVQVGTMHRLFYKFIVGDRQVRGFGTKEEQDMLKPPRLIAPPKRGVKSVSPTALSNAIRSMWTGCDPEALSRRYGFPAEWLAEPPKAKKASLFLNKWRGNDIGLADAKASVASKAEAQAYVWYEMYTGLKGDIPGWTPPCVSTSYENFMKRNRPGRERLGDLDDMLKVFLNILRRDPVAKKTVQGMFDHFLVDECQDLNLVQHQIFELMTEHVGDGSDGRSLWMIGDDKQAIYQFRGARPELFTSLDGKPGWKTRMIKTNYRCEPEIVDAANRLVAHNEGNIPMEARSNPTKARGKASIVLDTPEDNTAAAIQTIGRVAKDIAMEDAKPEDYAVLARTNAELNDFETACIINEIPYVRRGGKGFLEAPETKALLGYLDLVDGNDYQKMRDSLVAVLMKPDRGLYLGPEDVGKAVDEALDNVARRERVDVRSINPAMLLESRYVRDLADQLKQPYKLKIMSSAGNDRRKGEWMYGKRVEELENNLRGLKDNLDSLSRFIGEGKQDTPGLINYILDEMKSEVAGWDPVARRQTFTVTSLRDQITHDTSIFSDDDGEDDEEEEEAKPEVSEDGTLVMPTTDPEKVEPAKGLGAIQFLYQLAVPNGNDIQHNTDPSTAQGFVAKIARYAKLSETLRIDPDKWEREQQKLGGPHRKPPAITLSTVHCSPPDEKVLTVRGLVPIGELTPEDRLASYTKSVELLTWGEKLAGYQFVTGRRAFEGNLVVMETDGSKARVTPNHRVLVREAQAFRDKHVVYLTRRGEWWRLGASGSRARAEKYSGVIGQMLKDKAEAGWILGVFATREDATSYRAQVRAEYSLDETPFEAPKTRAGLPEQFAAARESRKTQVGRGARELLGSLGLDPTQPFYTSRQSGSRGSLRRGMLTAASNLVRLNGYLEVPVVTSAFSARDSGVVNGIAPQWRPVQVSLEPYSGEVCSLKVEPYETYISNGQVVGNSVKGLEWPNVSVLMPKGTFPPERKPREDEPPPDPAEEMAKLKAERNLAYVALTRAAVNLEVICPHSSGNGKKAGVSPFVFEAGLQPGENVPKPGAIDAPVEKTAVWEFASDDEVMPEFIADCSYDRR